MDNKLEEALAFIDPSSCNYQEWCNVGMALHYEGFSWVDWDNWSATDTERYHPGECEKKWKTFEGNTNPIKAGTIFQMAKERGFITSSFNTNLENIALDWNSTIKDDLVVVDKNWLEGKDVNEPKNWNPNQQLITYLSTLFEPNETVGVVVDSYETTDGRFVPTKGEASRTAGELIQQLNQYDIGEIFGDYNPCVGAWIRFNPLDGKGVKNENVTEYRYALVESDSMSIAKQNALLRELELPIATLVHSGKKSLHAVVKIDANDYNEYRKRVDFLYTICKKNGLDIDQQNRNPSRLSRMPGVTRNGHKQFLVDTNIGKASWDEWKEWIESINDDLPDPEDLSKVWDNLPNLAEPLIEGVLRKGHKMLIAGPSKAGKSFALIELTIALAEGTSWLGWNCAKGRVMYVNLELDRASCLHRFKDVYDSMKIAPNSLHNIDIWNLRGKSIPMDKLAPKLIRRAAKKDYVAIIIDPIYKVITGDENSADQMANFCNQFDKVCTELGCAVIYCHHHSKGAQGGKRSMDRASGSGVFARDPDALIDLIELELTEEQIKNEINNCVCSECQKSLNKHFPSWTDKLDLDDCFSGNKMLDFCKENLRQEPFIALTAKVNEKIQEIKIRTAWRVEGTLREFPKFDPVNLWFNYPIHVIDDSGVLKDIDPEDTQPAWKKGAEKRKKQAKSQKADSEAALENAYNALSIDGEVTVKAMAEYFMITENGMRKKLNKSSKFEFVKGAGTVTRK